MKKFLKMFGLAGLLAGMMMVAGCGDDNNTPATVEAKAAIGNVTPAPDGKSVVTTQQTTVVPADAPAALTAVSVTIPTATTITAKDANGNTITLTAPKLVFQAPADSTATATGVSGIPVMTGFSTVQSAAGAVEIQIEGAATATFSNPISIKIPVPGKAAGEVVNTVYKNKNNGAGYVAVAGGPFTVAVDKTITIQTSDFCWFVGDPVFRTSTGSTGGTGSQGTSQN